MKKSLKNRWRWRCGPAMAMRWRFFVLCSDASFSDGDVRKKQRCDAIAMRWRCDWKPCLQAKCMNGPHPNYLNWGKLIAI